MSLKRVSEHRDWISALLASGATAAGVEIVRSNSTLPLALSVVVVAVFPAAATILVTGAFGALQYTHRGRRWLAGSLWIEGYWFIYTLDAENESSPVSDGLMYIHFFGKEGDLSVIVYRPLSVGNRAIVNASESVLAVFREADLQFMNVCVQRFDNKEDRALGVGAFLRDGTERYPTRYSGWMIRIGEGIYRRQGAERIPERKVATNQGKYGADWIRRTIDEYSTASR